MRAKFLDPGVETWLAERQTPPRSPGHHVSDLLVAMLKRLNPSKYGEWGKREGNRHSIYELGFLWEDVLTEMLSKRRAVQQHEIVIPAREYSRDGIFGTPDLVVYDLERQRFVIEENKATFMTCRHLEGLSLEDRDQAAQIVLNHEDSRYWLWQSRTYAAMLGIYTDLLADHLPRSSRVRMHLESFSHPIIRLRALFMRGDYAGRGATPVPLCWEIGGEDDPVAYAAELEAWWQNVRTFAATLPPKESHD